MKGHILVFTRRDVSFFISVVPKVRYVLFYGVNCLIVIKILFFSTLEAYADKTQRGNASAFSSLSDVCVSILPSLSVE